MEKITLVVMNYATGEVLIYNFSNADIMKLKSIYGNDLSCLDLVECYAEDKFNPSEVCWMASQNINISTITPTIP